jgi:hypothetical protein
MATDSVVRIAMHRQKYFDQLALNWDREVTRERLECLNNIIGELNIKHKKWPGWSRVMAG